jgi:hypothetical protein
MSIESVYQVAHSWVDVGSFHARLLVRSMIVYSQSGVFWIYPRTFTSLLRLHVRLLTCVFNGEGPRTLRAVRGIS